MSSKIALKVLFCIACTLGEASFASAHIYQTHQARYAHTLSVHPFGTHRSLQKNNDASSPPMIAYQGYEGPAYLGHAGIPQSPLIPLKTEIPPPVDPNEPVSGSYGAMVHGSNAAGTGY